MSNLTQTLLLLTLAATIGLTGIVRAALGWGGSDE